MATFLRDRKVLAADIVAVQEPWRNEQQHTAHQPTIATFQLLYPAKETPTDLNQAWDQDQDPDRHQPGVCLFVSKKIDRST